MTKSITFLAVLLTAQLVAAADLYFVDPDNGDYRLESLRAVLFPGDPKVYDLHFTGGAFGELDRPLATRFPLESISGVAVPDDAITTSGIYIKQHGDDCMDIECLTAHVFARDDSDITHLVWKDNDFVYGMRADTPLVPNDVWVTMDTFSIPGDANMDGLFNSSDLIDILASGKYEDDNFAPTTWAEGDFNRDGVTWSNDLVFALAAGGYETGQAGPVTVPEPSGLVLAVLGLLVIGGRRHAR